ncbi:MAG: recombinase family protein [Candidatus Pacebacteria bacterium]|nr:recombinase family protein [Candidatus Paceibacterota bacterium]
MKNTDTQIKYGNYNRKSSEDRERQILSIGSQIDWAKEAAEKHAVKILKSYQEEKSAEAPYQRAVFDQMVKDIHAGIINALICWKLDRLARNPEEAGIILGMLKRGEIKHIITNEREYRPEDNAIISYVDFGMADQYSRDLSKNVKRGLKTKLNMGWYPSRAPLGYLNTKIAEKGENTIVNDPERFETVKRMWQTMLTGRYTAPQILQIVNNEWKFKTRTTKKFVGKPLCRATIYKIFNNRFYCGFYEFPKGSGEWYRGKHEPMVTEDEFEQVQMLLGNKKRPRPLTRRFAFTGLMRCGNCGAMITAEEKIKRQKNGNVHQYIYYRCTKRIDEKCPEKTVELKELTGQIDLLIRGLTISDKFAAWAIRYLHEVRQNEAKSHEEMFTNKQKRLTDVAKQMNNLLLKYTSSENSTGDLINDTEYKTLKLALTREKSALEGDLQTQSKEMERWIELSERTFHFARYASTWFEKGDLETKRAIFACLGSDLIVKTQKLNIQLHKPFQFIFDNLEEIEKELVTVRTSESEVFMGQKVYLDPSCLTLRRR